MFLEKLTLELLFFFFRFEVSGIQRVILLKLIVLLIAKVDSFLKGNKNISWEDYREKLVHAIYKI